MPSQTWQAATEFRGFDVDRKTIIMKALQKSAGLPLEQQAATVEMYLEIASDMDAPTQSFQPIASSSNYIQTPPMSALLATPVAYPDHELDRKVEISPVPEPPPLPLDDEPTDTERRSFQQIVNYVAEHAPKHMEVEMSDGGKLRVVLKQEPVASLKTFRLVAMVDGREGPQANFDVWEKNLDMAGKLEAIKRGVRAQFRPEKEAQRLANKPFAGRDFSREMFGVTIGADEGMSGGVDWGTNRAPLRDILKMYTADEKAAGAR